MKRKRYKLRRSVGVDADTVGAELERIQTERSCITPDVVVDEAKPKDAPLHPAFTWDNKKAAHKYRLYEARELIRAVHVITEENEDEGCAFVHVSELEGQDRGGYMSVDRVVEEPDLFASAVRGLRDKMNQAVKSLQDLERQAVKEGKRKQVKHIKGARKATNTAVQELSAIG